MREPWFVVMLVLCFTVGWIPAVWFVALLRRVVVYDRDLNE